MKRLICWSLAFLLGFSAFSQNGPRGINLDNWLKERKFIAKRTYELVSMRDGKHYLEVDPSGERIVKMSFLTGDTVAVLFNLKAIQGEKPASFFDFAFSADEKKILLATNRKSIYRHSFTAEYFIYQLGDNRLTPLSTQGSQQQALFSPDGLKIAFVRENNLFVRSLSTGQEVAVTTDGQINAVLNGLPDWVYEEEFGMERAFQWSPDSRHLAFIRFDESRVREFSMALYAGQKPEMKENALYPGISSFKYPKAGEDNSLVSVRVYDLEKSSTRTMDVGTETNIYLPRVYWTQEPGTLCMVRLNRLQNQIDLLVQGVGSPASAVLYSETNPYYIDEKVLDDIYFVEGKKQFVIGSERDGWYHLYLHDMKGKALNAITSGAFDVMEVKGLDSKTGRIYYVAASPNPWQREVYQIGLDGKNSRKLSQKVGKNSVFFSSDFSFGVLTHETANQVPRSVLIDSQGKVLRDLETNQALSDTLLRYRFNKKEFFSFTTGEGQVLHGWIIKPVVFDPTRKYPVLVTQYSGPNSQEVLDRFSIGWEQVLSELGYVVACIDPRGTGGRGQEFRKCTYMNLGKFETMDQLAGARYLSSLSYVDPSRLAIWGWSYGGFISSSCLVKGEGVFKAGIAVAPVTNWRYYDNIYTERFMRTPQENPKGYDDNSPLNFAARLQGKLLLVHGMADDNVHFQNSAELAERLVQANKQFEMQFYTNRNHNIMGGNTRYHLYNRMTEFLKVNL